MTATPKGNASGGATVVRNLAVRKPAARAAVSAGKKTGRAVDERVRKLAESR